MKIEGQIKLARTIVEQKEFIQWDGTDKHYYEIESYLRKEDFIFLNIHQCVVRN